MGDDNLGVLSADRPLMALQTLGLIGKVCIGSIVALLILIACAEGLDAVFS
jgi:hypothetical protein